MDDNAIKTLIIVRLYFKISIIRYLMYDCAIMYLTRQYSWPPRDAEWCLRCTQFDDPGFGSNFTVAVSLNGERNISRADRKRSNRLKI